MFAAKKQRQAVGKRQSIVALLKRGETKVRTLSEEDEQESRVGEGRNRSQATRLKKGCPLWTPFYLFAVRCYQISSKPV
jgi:hypothetical protein